MSDTPFYDDEPPAPARTRLVRPTFYRAHLTGSLDPDVRDLLIGIATMTDDEGWVMWRPEEIAATIYPYEAADYRLIEFHRRAAVLIERRLVIPEPCGCARVPRLGEHFGIKGGRRASTVWAFHQRHESVRVRTGPDESVPYTSSSSVSVSSSGSVSGEGSGEGATCDRCHRPTSVHEPKCPNAPHLRTVA